MWRCCRRRCGHLRRLLSLSMCRQDDGRCIPFVKHLGILYLVTFFVVLPILCSYLRHSVYHRKTRSRQDEITHMKTEHNNRLKVALQIVHAYSPKFQSSEKVRKREYLDKIDVAITIITVSRNRHKIDMFEPNYLTQAVGKYLELLSSSEAKQKRYQLFLCNVDPDPLTYGEFRNLSHLLPIFQRFQDKGKKVKYTDIFEKEKDDYVYCLSQTLQRNTDYVLLVEDDALPLDNFITMLNHVTDSRLKRNVARTAYAASSSDIAYVKLYHPDRLLGYYSLEYDRIPELVATGVFFGALLSYIYRRLTPTTKYHCNLCIIWMTLSCYIVLVAICIGRQNLLELRRLSKQLYLFTPTASCCTQAMLYPRDGGLKVAAYLSQITCKRGFAKDSALDQFRRETGARAYMLQPNVYQHIGLYSTLRRDIVDPFTI